MALPTQPVTIGTTASFTRVRRDCTGALPGDGESSSVLVSERAFVPLTWSKATSSDPTFRWRDFAYEIRESRVAPGSSSSVLMQCAIWSGGSWIPTTITSDYVLVAAYGVGRGWDPWFDSRLAEAKTRANGEIAKKLYPRVQKASVSFDLGVTLGEGKETLQYLLHAGFKIVSAAHDVRNFRFKRAMKTLRGQGGYPVPDGVRRDRTFAQNWLEYQFAIVPIVQDAYQFAEYMAGRALNTMFDAHRFSARSKVYIESVTDTGHGTYMRRSVSYHRRDTFLVKRRRRSEFETLMRELKLDNLASTLWEVSPLSWVIDAFVNVGNVLDSMAEFQEWEVMKGISSSRYRKYEYSHLAYSTSDHVSTGARYDIVTHYGRSTSPAWPTAVPLETTIPSNPGQWGSFLALLRVALTDK